SSEESAYFRPRLTSLQRRLTKHFTDISRREMSLRLTLKTFPTTIYLSEVFLARAFPWPVNVKDWRRLEERYAWKVHELKPRNRRKYYLSQASRAVSITVKDGR